MIRRAVLLALCVLAVAGCGGSGRQVAGPQRLGGGSGFAEGRRLELRLADCGDWNSAGPFLRNGILKGLAQFAGGPVGNGGLHGATLSDGRASRVLDDWCSRTYARAFKLYKLYERSAAFTPH